MANPWPAMAGWLNPDVPLLNKIIVWRCFHDFGICEQPPGSNRSGRIDEYNARAGAPLGSYWCMSAATAVWEDCGAAVPRAARASCDVVMDWAQARGQWHPDPIEGAMVLYGTKVAGKWKLRTDGSGKVDAQHVGIIMRRTPYLLNAEGNTSWEGFSRNGEAMLLKRVNVERVIGYVHPVKA